MSRAARLLLFAAAVIVVAAFVALRPDDEDQADSTSQPPATTTTTAPTTTDATDDPRPETRPQRPPRPRPQAVVVRGGEPVGGVQAIETSKGESVRFVVRSDVADEVHVHGYDISRDVAPGKPARFAFEAAIEGVFEIELEHRAVEIATLTVRP